MSTDTIEIVIRPKKRIFIALVSFATLAAAVICYCIWKLMAPGLSQLNYYLPYIIGVVVLLLVLSLMIGVFGIVLAILGVPTLKFFYYWAWHVINFLFPLAVFIGGLFNIPHDLAHILRGRNCVVNLIPANPVPEKGFARPSDAVVNDFFQVLKQEKINVTVRKEMGKDINAACGQLRANTLRED